MNKTPDHLKIWLISIALLSLSFLSDYYSPRWIESLHLQSSFDLLNTISGSSSQQSLDYYLGMCHQRLFGPASVVFSGLAFLIISWTYLLNVNSLIFASSVFLYLVVTKWPVLSFLPFGDTIGGPFAEAIWLKHNNFDYAGLTKEAGYLQGGPKVYLFSMYPSYLAALMRLIPSPKMFMVVNHVFVFAYGAVIISTFRSIMQLVTDHKRAMLSALLLLSLPLFQSQVEAINMEVPLTLFGILTFYYLVKKNIKMAALMAMLTILIKGVAIFLGAAVFLTSIHLFFFDDQRKFRKRGLVWGVVPVLFSVAQYYGAFYILNEGQISMVGAFQGVKRILLAKTFYIYVVSLSIFLWMFIQSKFKEGLSMSVCFNKHYIALVALTCAGGWFAIYVNTYAVIARYFLLLSPYIMFCLCFVLLWLIRSKKLCELVLCGLIVLSSSCSYGLFQAKPKDVNHINDHIITERSLEYRNGYYLNVNLISLLEEKYSHMTFGVPYLIAQSLALPELGYVKKDLDVLIYGYPCTYGDIKNFTGLKHLDTFKTLWVGLEYDVNNEMRGMISYPIDPKDRIVHHLAVGDRKATLFLGGCCHGEDAFIHKRIDKKLY